MSIEQKNTKESPNSIRNIRKRQLIELLKVDPTLTRRELADKLNISTVSVSNYLRILSSENALGEYPQLSQKRRERKSPKLVKPSKIENVVGERLLLSKIIRNLKYAKLAKLVKDNPTLTIKELAQKLNISTASVSNYLRRLSTENVLGECKYSNNKLTDLKCRKLIELLNEDPTLTIKDLAKKLNISSSSVSNYLRTLSTENALGECKYSNNKLIDLKCRKLVELLNEDPTLTIKDLAKKLNVSTASVSNYLRLLSDKNALCKRQRSSGKHIEPRCRDLAELINKDPTLNNDDLAKMLNVSTKTLSKYLRTLSDKNLLCERQSSNTKKCERKRNKLVELLNANPTLTNKELAEKLDISTSALSQYLRTLSDENVSIERHTLGRKRSEDKIINKERVAELIKQDPTLTYKEISKLIGVSFVTVRNYILELREERLQVE